MENVSYWLLISDFNQGRKFHKKMLTIEAESKESAPTASKMSTLSVSQRGQSSSQAPRDYQNLHWLEHPVSMQLPAECRYKA